MRSLVTRLKRLEDVRAAEQQNGRLIIEYGYVIKRLPPDCSGPSHLVTVGRLPDGKHQGEERPGPPSQDEGWVLRVEFVKAPAADKMETVRVTELERAAGPQKPGGLT